MRLFVPEAARKRWLKELPRGYEEGLELARFTMKTASHGGIMAWRIDRADLLVLAGDEPARCEDMKDGVVIIRGDAKAPTSSTKWKKKAGTILVVRAPMALCGATDLGDAVPAKVAKGRYDVSFAPSLIRLSLA